jgi:hypothetical protein
MRAVPPFPGQQQRILQPRLRSPRGSGYPRRGCATHGGLVPWQRRRVCEGGTQARPLVRGLREVRVVEWRPACLMALRATGPAGGRRPGAVMSAGSRRQQRAGHRSAGPERPSWRSPCALQAPHQGDRALVVHGDGQQRVVVPCHCVGRGGLASQAPFPQRPRARGPAAAHAEQGPASSQGRSHCCSRWSRLQCCVTSPRSMAA